MPGDNAATVAVGAAVEFPQNGEASGIVRLNATEFVLPTPGVYEVFFQVSVTEAGQLELWINGAPAVGVTARSVAGRATGTSQIVNSLMIRTIGIGDTLSVRNPSGNSTALTITPIAGGTESVSATLVIKQIS